jgi:hypothetical protein
MRRERGAVKAGRVVRVKRLMKDLSKKMYFF